MTLLGGTSDKGGYSGSWGGSISGVVTLVSICSSEKSGVCISVLLTEGTGFDCCKLGFMGGGATNGKADFVTSSGRLLIPKTVKARFLAWSSATSTVSAPAIPVARVIPSN